MLRKGKILIFVPILYFNILIFSFRYPQVILKLHMDSKRKKKLDKICFNEDHVILTPFLYIILFLRTNKLTFTNRI